MGWIIVATSFIALALLYSLQYSFSVFFVALIKEFGWSRSIGSGAFSLFAVLSSMTGPVVGSLISTFGLQRVVLVGALVMGLGLALCSLIESWWHFYLFFGVITAAGLGATGWIPNVTLIHLWFRERRGLAMGIISSGIGIGIFVCVPAIQHLIVRFGWRMSYCLMAFFIPLVVVTIALTLLGRTPSPKRAPFPEERVSSATARDPLIIDQEWASRSWSLKKAAGTRPFWHLCLVFFLGNFMAQSIFMHQVAFFVDHRLSAVYASYLVGLVGVVSLVSKIVWGGLSDRIGREMTYTAGMACMMLSMVLLILFDHVPFTGIAYLFPVCFGMGYAVTAALPPLITADLFEGPAYGSIFGSFMAFSGMGAALGAWFAGLIFDWSGSYVPTFIMNIVSSWISCFSIWKAGPGKVRRVPERIGRIPR